MQGIQADLIWQAGLPYSRQFNDVYFSVSDADPQHGLSESRHVFLQHNHLPARWAVLAESSAKSPMQHFTVLETGFGSGLNFLATVACWFDQGNNAPPPNLYLHFVSLEIAPFSHADLTRALAHFPSLAPLAQALLAQYHLLHPGINLLEFPQWQVSLTLIIGDALTWLPQLNMRVDAWFLDGFAPSKNPSMWSDALFTQMARLSDEDTTFATFTCAGQVRRGLQQAGFQVQKVTGYGAKREMLCGRWPTKNALFRRQRHLVATPEVAVIGAGIAGASTAWQLAQLGAKVTVFERAATAATGASGNPYGMLYPRLNSEKVTNDTLALQSYAYTLRHYAKLLKADDFQACGLLQLGASPRELKRVQKVSRHYAELGWFWQVNPQQASTLAGVEITHEAIYFPHGAWVNPVAACNAMLAHPNITMRTEVAITALVQSPAGWQCRAAASLGHEQTFDAVVVANAVDARALLPALSQELQPIRGQMTMLEAESASQALNTILCGDGYLTPARAGQHALGATFHPRQTNTEVLAADNLANLEMMQALSPQFASVSPKVTYARASLRCGTRDYLPCVGEVNMPLAHLVNPKETPTPTSPLAPSVPAHTLFCHVGHGSKGLLTAPYCAALLARRVLLNLGVTLPQVSDDGLWQGLQPERLTLQSHKKSYY